MDESAEEECRRVAETESLSRKALGECCDVKCFWSTYSPIRMVLFARSSKSREGPENNERHHLKEPPNHSAEHCRIFNFYSHTSPWKSPTGGQMKRHHDSWLMTHDLCMTYDLRPTTQTYLLKPLRKAIICRACGRCLGRPVIFLMTGQSAPTILGVNLPKCRATLQNFLVPYGVLGPCHNFFRWSNYKNLNGAFDS